jgi:hypothetical protein
MIAILVLQRYGLGPNKDLVLPDGVLLLLQGFGLTRWPVAVIAKKDLVVLPDGLLLLLQIRIGPTR